MDRDAAPASPAPAAAAPAEVVPPVEWAAVRNTGLAGVALIAVAAGLGLAGAPPEWPGHTARMLLVLAGAVTAGGAVSLRPDLWKAWAVGAGAALLAVAGTPAHWDTFRLLFGVLTAVALVGTAFRLVPLRYRLAAVTAILLFHFAGIVLATTTPPTGNYPAPWVTEQAFVRVFNPYLQFIYMRNAYHFYSPEPGAASVLVFLLKTETGRDAATGEKQYTTKWVVLPKRPGDVKDPLGLTYYRRLSITEQLARGTPGLRANTFEAREMIARRQLALGSIPKHPTDPEEIQFQLPQAEVARFVLPSYASHVILENTPDTATAGKTTVKVYRMQHNTMSVDDFTNWRKRPNANTSPYHPTTYRPFFLGEYDVHGNLMNPQERMLYWLVPIISRPMGVPPPGSTHKRDYVDFMSIHALDPLNLSVDEVDDPKFKDRVFDWGQLR